MQFRALILASLVAVSQATHSLRVSETRPAGTRGARCEK